MKTRNGKIARLPKKIRDQINQRLQDGWTGPKLVEWLNSLPRVQHVLRDNFASQPVTEQNLSHWREGGYADWLYHQETQAQTRWMIERSGDVDTDENGKFLCEHVANVVTAELAQHTQQLSAIKDPLKRWKQFREISLELWRLRNGTHHCRSVDLRRDRWDRAVEQEDTELSRQNQSQHSPSQEEYLEHFMNLMHIPEIRAWIRTDWPSKDAEMARLREIYHLRPGSRNTPSHPSQFSAEGAHRAAIYHYPTESK